MAGKIFVAGDQAAAVLKDGTEISLIPTEANKESLLFWDSDGSAVLRTYNIATVDGVLVHILDTAKVLSNIDYVRFSPPTEQEIAEAIAAAAA